MITLRIVNWPNDTGLDHVSTSWQIADKVDFLNIIDEVTEDTTFLNIYRSNIVIPVGKEYYGHAKRHFINGASTEWIGPIKIISNESGENIDIKPEVYIEEPSVSIIDDVINNRFIIKSGSFRCKDDGHKSTTWILKDGIGNVLFRSMYDVNNKKEIFVDKTIITNNTNVLLAEVVHNSTNDYESNFGSFRLELNKFNFEVVSNTKNITVNEDYYFRFKIINNNYILSRYDLKDDEGNLIQESMFFNNVDFIMVEREKLKPNTTYNISIYSDSLPDDVNITTFYTNANESIFKVNKEYVYNNEYISTDITINNFRTCMVEQFIDNGIPLLHNNNNTLDIFHYNRRLNTFTISDLAVDFIKDTLLTSTNIVVKVINNDLILIDTLDDNSKPIFKIYNYTLGKFIKGISRTDELSNSFNANNITVGLNNKVYYYAEVNNEIVLRCYDINNDSISTLSKRPYINSLDANLVYIGNDRLMSFNGSIDKHLVYLYDISDGSWFEVAIVPLAYRTLKMVSFLRKDGKVISFNTSDGSNDVLIFDPKDNSFIVEINELDDTIDLNSTIRLRDGEFLRYDSRQNNPIIYRFR